MGIKKKKSSSNFLRYTEVLPQPNRLNTVERAIREDISKKPYVLKGTSADGEMTLKLVFPLILKNGAPYQHNVSFLERIPNLRDFIISILLQKFRLASSPGSIKVVVGGWKTGLYLYLSGTDSLQCRLSNIDESFLRNFIRWLNLGTPSNRKSTDSTRANRYMTMTTLLKSISANREQVALLSPGLYIPYNPWPGRGKAKSEPKIIDNDLMTRLRIACLKEVEVTVKKFDAFSAIRDVLMMTKKGLVNSTPDFLSENPPVLFNCVDLLSLGKILPLIRELPWNVKTALNELGVDVERDIAPCYYPNARSLVPFVILLTLDFSYNADTSRNAKLTDFRFDNVLGSYFSASADEEAEAPRLEQELTVRGYKGRSKRRQPVTVPVDDSLDNPATLYRFLVKWSFRLRSICRDVLKNDLFLHYSPVKEGKVSSFALTDGNMNTETFNYSLRRFRECHGLEYFTLDMIRPTVLNVALEAGGEDPHVVKTQAHHKNVSTVLNSYISASSTARQSEILAELFMLRTRWRETQGKVDPRDKTDREDLSCSTPGWNCFDAFDSPFSKKGKLCQAYGLCPACPLGFVDLNSPLSAAYSLALLDALNRSQQSVSPVTWFARHAPAKNALEVRWLPAYSETAMDEARKLEIPYLPLPE